MRAPTLFADPTLTKNGGDTRTDNRASHRPLSESRAARGEDGLPRQPAGLVGRQEYRDIGDVVRAADAAERRPLQGALFEIAADDADGAGTFGFHQTGIDGVDPDLARPEFLGEHPRDAVDRRLGAGIDGAARRREAADQRADIDDAAALRSEL